MLVIYRLITFVWYKYIKPSDQLYDQHRVLVVFFGFSVGGSITFPSKFTLPKISNSCSMLTGKANLGGSFAGSHPNDLFWEMSFHNIWGTRQTMRCQSLRMNRRVIWCGRPLTNCRCVWPLDGPSTRNFLSSAVVNSQEAVSTVILLFGGIQGILPEIRPLRIFTSASGSGGYRLFNTA